MSVYSVFPTPIMAIADCGSGHVRRGWSPLGGCLLPSTPYNYSIMQVAAPPANHGPRLNQDPCVALCKPLAPNFEKAAYLGEAAVIFRLRPPAANSNNITTPRPSALHILRLDQLLGGSGEDGISWSKRAWACDGKIKTV